MSDQLDILTAQLDAIDEDIDALFRSAAEEGRDLTDEEQAEMTSLEGRRATTDRGIKHAERRAERAEKARKAREERDAETTSTTGGAHIIHLPHSDPRVREYRAGSEERVYHRNSTHSFIRDAIDAARGASDAVERLDRHHRQERSDSSWGREYNESIQYRATTTTDAGYILPAVWPTLEGITDTGDPFASVCRQSPLTSNSQVIDYRDQATQVGEQMAEGNAVSSRDMEVESFTIESIDLAGRSVVSNQTLRWSMLDEQRVTADLMRQLALQRETLCLTGNRTNKEDQDGLFVAASAAANNARQVGLVTTDAADKTGAPTTIINRINKDAALRIRRVAGMEPDTIVMSPETFTEFETWGTMRNETPIVRPTSRLELARNVFGVNMTEQEAFYRSGGIRAELTGRIIVVSHLIPEKTISTKKVREVALLARSQHLLFLTAPEVSVDPWSGHANMTTGIRISQECAYTLNCLPSAACVLTGVGLEV